MRTPDDTATRLAAALAEAAPRDDVRRAVLADVAELAPTAPRGLLRRAFDAKWPIAALGAAAAAALLIATPPRRGGAPSATPPAVVAAPGAFDPYGAEDPAVVRARKANEEAWTSMAADVVAKHKGAWAVVGDGKLLAIGQTLFLVAGTGADLPHRFVFEVGTEGDGEEFISSWYGTRFCGGGIHEALGTDWQAGASGFQLSKGGKTVRATLGDAFPRLVVNFLDPDPRMHDPLPAVAGEVFFGTVGPTMMLTPQDHRRLGLARFEIPGSVKLGGFGTARRVLVRVRVAAVEADATVAALVPEVPYGTLVAFARGRNSWWQWGESIQPEMPETLPFRGNAGPPVPAPGEAWILFGRDRILASGDSPAAALAGAAKLEDVDYHRFLMRVPREQGVTLREVDFEKAPRSLDLNGAAHPGRPSKSGGPILVTAEVGRALRLELAEDPRDLRLDLDAKPGEPNACGLRGGYAWLREADPSKPGQTTRRLVLVVYPDAC